MAHSIIFTGLPLIRKLDRPPIGFLGTGRRVFERTPVTNLGSDVNFPFVKTWACACRPGLPNLLFLDRINIGISCSTTALHWLGKKDEAASEMEKAPSWMDQRLTTYMCLFPYLAPHFVKAQKL